MMAVFTAQSEIHCKQFLSMKTYTSFKWDMVQFSMLGQFHEQMTSEFAINGTASKCKLKFQLDGEKRIIVNINFNDCNSEMNVIVSIIDGNGGKKHTVTKIKQNNDDKCTLVISLNYGWKCYLHDNYLTLFCEFILKKPLTQLQSTLVDGKKISVGHNDDSITTFENFFKEKYLVDVKIIVGHREFEVHKIVLVASSPVFEAMFTDNMIEQRENIVTIIDIDANVFEAFLKYMYTGTMDRDKELASDLRIVADKYEVLNLIKFYDDYIADNLNTHTEHYCRQFADKTEYTSFKWDLIDFHQLRDFHEASTTEFQITNTQYKCGLKLNIDDEGRVGLTINFPKDCDLPIKVIFSIIDTSSNAKEFTRSYMKTDKLSWIWFYITHLSSIPGTFLHNGTLTVLCELVHVQLAHEFECVIMDRNKLHTGNFANDLLTKLNVYYENKCFCDVILIVENREFHAHRVVLAANSTFLKAEFADKEKNGAGTKIAIDDVDVTTFEAFLRFMYTGSIDHTEKLVRDLLIVAHNYGVRRLKELCQTYVAKYLEIKATDALFNLPDSVTSCVLGNGSILPLIRYE